MNRDMLARLLERHCPTPALIGIRCGCGTFLADSHDWSEHVTRAIYPPSNVAGPYKLRTAAINVITTNYATEGRPRE